MISCRLHLKDFKGAMLDIETALLWGINTPIMLMKKVEILM
jgi:hypothetical protein